MRYLIVNADDFGLSAGINLGVIRAHEHGIVTSASLMTTGRAVESAVAYARSHPELSVGLHLDLGEWEYRDGGWHPVYLVVPPKNHDAAQSEVRRQVALFIDLIGRPPTQLDSHQHAHRDEPLRSIALAESRRLGVPLRHVESPACYCGRFYGQTTEGREIDGAITPDGLIETLRSLPEGWTELACHPGLEKDAPSPYRPERAIEVATLCDPQVRMFLGGAGIELRSFHDAPRCRS